MSLILRKNGHKQTQPNQITRSTMSFLPQGYQAPRSSNNYMKLQDGENRVRILTAPIVGWEDWLDTKPVRYKMDEKPQRPYDPKKAIKHFWSFVVWNYDEESIQVLHITQASIRNAIEALCNDKDWGAPYFYDIKIVKKGEKMDTEYMVNPIPHKNTAEYILDQFNEKPCYLEAIFTNEDPFDKGHMKHTPCFSENDESLLAVDVASGEQVMQLQGLLAQCDEDYRSKVYEFIKKNYGKDISQIEVGVFERLYNAALKKVSSLSTPDF